MSRIHRLIVSAASLTLAVAVAVVGVGASWAADTVPAEQKPLPFALVDALNKLAGGPHPGYRANHAKGILAEGTFTPAPTARSLSKAPHFLKSVPVLVRFSDTTGVPTLPDANPNASPHGMAIRFKLPDGSNTDIVSISANSFPVSTPEDFLAFLQAAGNSGPDAPKPTPIEQFLGSHPAAKQFVTTARPAPVSFGTLAFYGVNAFKFTSATGASHYVRYQIIPVAGEQVLSDADAAIVDQNYLMAELPKRIAGGPVKFKLMAQVALPEDSTTDATMVWPANRKVVLLGTLSLTSVPAEQKMAQKVLLYNPLALPTGIEASADPVLLARPAAYGVSFTQRAQ